MANHLLGGMLACYAQSRSPVCGSILENEVHHFIITDEHCDPGKFRLYLFGRDPLAINPDFMLRTVLITDPDRRRIALGVGLLRRLVARERAKSLPKVKLHDRRL